MSNNKIDISLIQFATYVRPSEAVDKSRNWVLNGKKNSFYQYIIDRASGSPTNASINKTYTDLILGQGLSFKPTPGGSSKNAQDWARLKTILKDSDLKKIATDFQVFGASSLQVQTNNKNELISISHAPKQQIVPSIENEDGIIEMYWQSKNWAEPYKVENTPVPYPTFGSSKEGLEIYVIRPYTVGMTYFESPDYISCLQYAESEEEISNMNINAIRNGLSTGFILNVKNGINLEPEDKKKFKDNVTEKLAGSENGGNFIVSFNGEENEVEVIPFPTSSGIHKQWEVLNDVCASKIMTSHRVISRSIVGLEANTGFSSSADEMLVAEQQTLKRVIAPKQKYITDALEEILQVHNINLDLFFKPLTEAPVEAAPVQMASVEKKKPNADALMALGEDLPEGYDIISDERCDEITFKESDLNTLFEFASVPVTPRKKSEQDTSLFKIRYRYAGEAVGERDFCNKVINANKLYRAEDLDFNSNYNEDFAPKGKNSYNAFLYKGGVNCKHWWQRVVLLKSNNDKISVNKAQKMILELEPGKERNAAKWDKNPKVVAEIASASNNYHSLTPNYRR